MVKHSFSLLLFLSLLAATAMAGVLEPAVAITKVPFEIKKPGTYVLAKNLVLNGTTGAAITISADNVVLDLGEHTISNPAPAAANTLTLAEGIVAAGRSNLTIRRGTLTGFSDGINIVSGATPDLTRIDNVTCNQCSHSGIDLTGDIVDIRNCHADYCGAALAPSTVWGILVNCNFATVVGCEVLQVDQGQGDDARGIQASVANGCLIRQNNVINTTTASFGIIIFGGSGNFAADNTIAGFSDGLDFANSAPGKYLNNLVLNCTTPFFGGTAATGNN